MIQTFNNFNNKNYPLIRHLTSYETAISILEHGFIYSRNELKNKVLSSTIVENENLNKDNKWFKDRQLIEKNKFNTNDLIYCTPDWFQDYKHETGHGAVMFYFNENIFNDYKISLTKLDSKTDKYDNEVFYNEEILDIYSNILGKKINNKYKSVSDFILENNEILNEEGFYNTSKGKKYIESLFHYKYSEIQIHTNKIPIKYIESIKITDKYFDVRDTDNKNKLKLKKLIN